MLHPNYKIVLGMYVNDQIFINSHVSFRIKIELEDSNPDNLEHIATLTVNSRRNKNLFTEVYDNVPVFGHTKTIDVGFEPNNLCLNKRDTLLGESVIQIIYKAKSGTLPLKIKTVQVYTLEGVDESITEKSLCIGMKDLGDFVCLQVQKSQADALSVGDSPEVSRSERDGLPGYAEIFEPRLAS